MIELVTDAKVPPKKGRPKKSAPAATPQTETAPLPIAKGTEEDSAQ
jgi:hypothetical protein